MRIIFVLIICALSPLLHSDDKAGTETSKTAEFQESNPSTSFNFKDGKILLTLGSEMIIINVPPGMNPYESFEVKNPKGGKVIFRMLGNEPLRIDGTLTPNGDIIVISPNGVIVGTEAKIDISSSPVPSTLEPTEVNSLGEIPVLWGDHLLFNYDSLSPGRSESAKTSVPTKAWQTPGQSGYTL